MMLISYFPQSLHALMQMALKQVNKIAQRNRYIGIKLLTPVLHIGVWK